MSLTMELPCPDCGSDEVVCVVCGMLETVRLKVLLGDAMGVLARIRSEDVRGEPSWLTEARVMVEDYRKDGDGMSTL